MKKILTFGLAFLLGLSACQAKNVDERPEESSLQEESLYLGILIEDDLFLVKEEKEETFYPLYISNRIENLGIGEMMKFHLDGGVLKSYPGQAKAKDMEVIPGKVKELSIDLDTASDLKAFGGDRISLLDVRSYQEYLDGHLEEAEHMPLDSLAFDIGEKHDKDQVLLVYCRSGVRSKQAQKILEEQDYFSIDAGGVLDYQGTLVK